MLTDFPGWLLLCWPGNTAPTLPRTIRELSGSWPSLRGQSGFCGRKREAGAAKERTGTGPALESSLHHPVGARSLAHILLAMLLARVLQGLCLEVMWGGYAGGAYKNMELITHRQDSNYRGLGCWGGSRHRPADCHLWGLD